MESDLILVVAAQVLVIGAVAAAIGVLLLRHLVCRRRVRARGRAVLVTGCDRGVGLELAAHLDALGFRVLAAVREPCGEGAARLQARTSVLTRLVTMDVTSCSGVAAAAAQVRRELQDTGTELWAVINNAGVCIPGELQWLTWEQCQRSIQVNLEGAVRVTRTFLPLLQQANGRVLFVTSCFTGAGLPGVGLLSATSAALDALADCLRLEAQGKVKVATVRLGDFSLTTGLLSDHHREVAAMRAALTDAAEVDRFSSYQDAVASRGLTLRSAAPPQPLPKSVCAAFEDALLARRPMRAYQVAEGVGARLGRWLRARLPRDLRDALVMRRFGRQLPKVTHL